MHLPWLTLQVRDLHGFDAGLQLARQSFAGRTMERLVDDLPQLLARQVFGPRGVAGPREEGAERIGNAVFAGRGGSGDPWGFTLAPPRKTFSDAAVTVPTDGTRVLAQIGTMSAARTATLPAANTVPAGWTIDIIDESGTPSWWWYISVVPAGSDTINGLSSTYPHQINLPYCGLRLISNGGTGWFAFKLVSARTDMWIYDDDMFAQGTNMGVNFLAVASSGTVETSVAGTNPDSRPGFGRLRAGNVGTTDRVAIQQSTVNQITFGGGLWRQEWKGNIPVLSAVAQEYQAYWGFGDQNGAVDQTDGFYFIYDRLNLGTTFQYKSAAAGTRTTKDSAITVTAAQEYRWGLEINAAASSATPFIDGTSYTACTTNIPATTNIFGILARMNKTAGTNAVAALDFDRFRMLFMASTPRV